MTLYIYHCTCGHTWEVNNPWNGCGVVSEIGICRLCEKKQARRRAREKAPVHRADNEAQLLRNGVLPITPRATHRTRRGVVRLKIPLHCG